MTNNTYHCRAIRSDELKHYQVKGAKHGVRRYQYKEDGSLTPLGREHYGVGPPRETGAEVISKKYKAAKKTIHDYVVKKKRQRGLARVRKAKAKQKAQEERIEKAKRDAEEAKIAQEARIEKAKRDAEEAKAEASKKSAEADVTNAETKAAQAEKAANKEEANGKKFSSKEYSKYTDEELAQYIERKRLEKSASELKQAQVERGKRYVGLAVEAAKLGVDAYKIINDMKNLKIATQKPDYKKLSDLASKGEYDKMTDADMANLINRKNSENTLYNLFGNSSQKYKDLAEKAKTGNVSSLSDRDLKAITQRKANEKAAIDAYALNPVGITQKTAQDAINAYRQGILTLEQLIDTNSDLQKLAQVEKFSNEGSAAANNGQKKKK